MLPVFVATICVISGSFAFPVNAQVKPGFLIDDDSYFWPTNASRYISSTFGETRSAHFHAAIDIGTWGHEGYAVFAARDGIVHRVAVGPAGYGNVIYLRHKDESISIYAHLKDFHPQIRNIVDSLRMQDYSFEFDENMEAYDIRFRRGQQIGWTGSTGVGPPHLHFELRTPTGNPFNPLLAGIRIEDTIAPRFAGLVVEPLSSDSKINGMTGRYNARATYRDGQFDFGEVNVTGVTGLAVDVFDRANASNNVHAVYELKMFVNGERYFHSRTDSFSYRQSRQMFLDRVFPILTKEGKGYQRLYIREGNSLPFYENSGKTGKLHLPTGTHKVRIEAADYFGNRSVAVVRLNVRESDNSDVQTVNSGWPEKSSVQASEPPGGLYWHNNWVKLVSHYHNTANPINPGENDKASMRDSVAIRPLGSFREEKIQYITSDHSLPLDVSDRTKLHINDKKWTLHRIHPEYPVTLYKENMRISVQFPAESFFEPVSIGYTGKYPEFSIFPESEPFQRPATVRILLDENLRKKKGVGLYQKDPVNGELSHISSFIDLKCRTLVGSITSAGMFTIRADTTSPSLSTPEISKWSHKNLHFVTVEVDDDLSGIDYHSAEFHVNNRRGIAEYDHEKKLLRYHHPDFSPNPVNEVTVRISDQAGNMTEKTFSDVPNN